MNTPPRVEHPDASTPAGAPVTPIEDVVQFGEVVLRAGEVGYVRWISGPHATANGGGWDVSLDVDGRRFPGFTFDAAGHYVKNPDGSYVITPEARDFVTVRSTNLEVLGR